MARGMLLAMGAAALLGSPAHAQLPGSGSLACSAATDVFAGCRPGLPAGELDAACCTSYRVLRMLSCFW